LEIKKIMIEPVLPKPTLPKPVVRVATIAYPPPLIVIDKFVVKPPPDIQQIIDVRIDVKTADGTKDDHIITPPLDVKATQVIAVVVQKKNEDTVFYKVEIEAAFPGGADAWSKYVSKEVGGNIDEFSESDFGTCMVKFIVDKTGKVSHYRLQPVTFTNPN